MRWIKLIRVAIIGATGYTGVELVRLLQGHPKVGVVGLTSQSYSGKHILEVYPHLHGICLGDNGASSVLTPDVGSVLAKADLVFIALPSGHAVPVVKEALGLDKRVIDLGADFRFRNAATYKQWYKLEHGAPELLAETVYGLPELYRGEIKKARSIANPGCYPTSAILALAPALRESLIDPDTIVIDSKSGVSGAGRDLTLGSMFSEANENVNPYGVAFHRHTPEIEQELGRLAGQDVMVSFTPHLVPMTRGILSTIYASLARTPGEKEVREIYRSYYREEPFICILPEGRWPHTKWAFGSNHCFLGLAVDIRTNRLILASALDNLIKGAAGQAVQNMNIMFDLPENLGLDRPGSYP